METNGDLILKVLNKELTLSEAFRQSQENVFDYLKNMADAYDFDSFEDYAPHIRDEFFDR